MNHVAIGGPGHELEIKVTVERKYSVPVSVKLRCADQVLTRHSCRLDVWIIAEDGRGDDTVEPVTGTERQILESLKKEVEGLDPKLQGYMEAREHLLQVTVKEKTAKEFQKLEMSLKNEQRENAWLQRAVKENKRKRADRLSRLQQEITDLKRSSATKGDTFKMYEGGYSNPKDSLQLGNLMR